MIGVDDDERIPAVAVAVDVAQDVGWGAYVGGPRHGRPPSVLGVRGRQRLRKAQSFSKPNRSRPADA